MSNWNDDLLGKVKSYTYYFIYTEFDDEGGKYYPVEGVTVGLGQAPTATAWDIIFYGNSRFNWDSLEEDIDLPEDSTDDTKEEKDDDIKDDAETPSDKNEDKREEKDETTAATPLPNTGKKAIILGFTIVFVLSSIILYCVNKKYSFIK